MSLGEGRAKATTRISPSAGYPPSPSRHPTPSRRKHPRFHSLNSLKKHKVPPSLLFSSTSPTVPPLPDLSFLLLPPPSLPPSPCSGRPPLLHSPPRPQKAVFSIKSLSVLPQQSQQAKEEARGVERGEGRECCRFGAEAVVLRGGVFGCGRLLGCRSCRSLRPRTLCRSFLC